MGKHYGAHEKYQVLPQLFVFDQKKASLLWNLGTSEVAFTLRQARRRRSATIEARTPNGIWMVVSPWKLGKMKPF